MIFVASLGNPPPPTKGLIRQELVNVWYGWCRKSPSDRWIDGMAFTFTNIRYFIKYIHYTPSALLEGKPLTTPLRFGPLAKSY